MAQLCWFWKEKKMKLLEISRVFTESSDMSMSLCNWILTSFFSTPIHLDILLNGWWESGSLFPPPCCRPVITTSNWCENGFLQVFFCSDSQLSQTLLCAGPFMMTFHLKEVWSVKARVKELRGYVAHYLSLQFVSSLYLSFSDLTFLLSSSLPFLIFFWVLSFPPSLPFSSSCFPFTYCTSVLFSLLDINTSVNVLNSSGANAADD